MTEPRRFKSRRTAHAAWVVWRVQNKAAFVDAWTAWWAAHQDTLDAIDGPDAILAAEHRPTRHGDTYDRGCPTCGTGCGDPGCCGWEPDDAPCRFLRGVLDRAGIDVATIPPIDGPAFEAWWPMPYVTVTFAFYTRFKDGRSFEPMDQATLPLATAYDYRKRLLRPSIDRVEAMWGC